MSIISKGKLVRFHFDMLTEDGSIVASTREGEPLAYVHGVMHTDPPALGEKLEGRTSDFSGDIILEPEDAYGEQLLSPEESMDSIPLDSFPEGMEVAKGVMFEAEIAKQGRIWCTIMDIQEDNAIIYYGHPLAGQTILYRVDIVEVRNATEEDVRTLYAMYNPDRDQN